MSTHIFKPGAVAMVECSDGEWRRAGYRRATVGNPEAWEFEDGAMRRVNESRTRPLVVIDPEDGDAVEALADAFVAAFSRPTPNMASVADIEAMRDALRQLADPKPPRPEEPTGLGAVVEDSRGELWVRADRDDLPWTSGGDTWYGYTSIDAVKKLSDGVTEGVTP